jgi:hypothetical protein
MELYAPAPDVRFEGRAKALPYGLWGGLLTWEAAMFLMVIVTDFLDVLNAPWLATS